MQKLGLTRAQLAAYHDTLRSSHTRSVEVEVLNLDGQEVARLAPRLLDGQVTVDLDAEVTRTLTLSLLDPNHKLDFDSDSPDDGALYADRMLRVTYTVRVPGVGLVDCVVFTGPIIKLDRNADVVSVEAHGKERMALGELWRPLNIKKGTKKTEAVRTILERTGERRFAFPDLKTRIPTRRSLDRFTPGWTHARKIAESMNLQLYYPGNGVCVLRDWPSKVMYTFSTGNGGDVLSDIAISNNMDDFKNVVLAVGAKPKGSKHRVRYAAVASGILAPGRMGRNGQPRYMVEQIEDDNLRSVAECKRRAERVLEDRLAQMVEVTFDALPIPHLDPGDKVRVKTTGDGGGQDGDVVTFRLRRFTIPLGTDGDPVMSVGYLKKTYPNRRAIRR